MKHSQTLQNKIYSNPETKEKHYKYILQNNNYNFTLASFQDIKSAIEEETVWI